VARGDGTIQVLDADTGKEAQTRHRHLHNAVGVVFSPDGARLASASEDQTIKLWDVATGQEVLTLRGIDGWEAYNGLAFSPDGRWLAAPGKGGTVKVWDGRPLPVPAAPRAAARVRIGRLGLARGTILGHRNRWQLAGVPSNLVEDSRPGSRTLAMLQNLALERPLAILDLETTGTDPQVDRIVEISVLKIHPDGRHEQLTTRLNPGMPIPPAATAVHGIDDAAVAAAPAFAEVAGRVLDFLDGCDLGGFNLKRFDLRLLYTECSRAGRTLPLEGRGVIDAMEIFHTYERRDLAAAVRFYCGREHADGHQAAADVRATVDVLDAMLARYADLPRTVAGLHLHFKVPDTVDSSGCFTRVEGEIRFAFGKYRGQPLHLIAVRKPDYLEWMLNQSFFDDTKQVVREALTRARASGKGTVERPRLASETAGTAPPLRP
jgi:DNA polymerase-3 subunit epsilon